MKTFADALELADRVIALLDTEEDSLTREAAIELVPLKRSYLRSLDWDRLRESELGSKPASGEDPASC